MHSGKAAALVALIVVNLIWGFNVATTKLAVEEISPLAFNAIRTGIGVAILLPWGIRAGMWPVMKRRWPILLLSGLLGLTISQTGYAFSLQLAPGAIIAVLSALGPATLVMMFVLAGEHISRSGWLGTALAMLGALLVLGLSPSELGAQGVRPLIGGIVLLASITSWNVFNVVAKRLLVREEPLAMATAASLFGWLGLLFVFGVSTGTGHAPIHFSFWPLFAIFYSGVLISAFAFLALNWALKRLEGTRVGGVSYIHPAVGVLSAWVILGETPGPTFVLGSLLVLAGVYLVTTARVRGAAPVERPATAARPELNPEGTS